MSSFVGLATFFRCRDALLAEGADSSWMIVGGAPLKIIWHLNPTRIQVRLYDF